MVPSRKIDARELALRVLAEVWGRRAFASKCLDTQLKERPLAENERALATQLVYGVLREQGFLDAVLKRYLSFSKTPAKVLQVLRLGAYQCLALDKIPDYAVVHSSVDLAKRRCGAAPARMVNAVLRRVLEDREEILRDPARRAEASVPDWLLQRWRRRYSAETLAAMLDYFNGIPPLGLRVNPRRADSQALVSEWAQHGLASEPEAGTPLLLLRRYDRERLAPWLEAGKISLQDPHSYRVAQAVAARAGERGLDACAGHGGKTAAIAESLPDDAEIFIHEPQAERRRELRQNFARLGLPPPREVPDAATAERENLRFNWILVDAPCSGLGTVGRKPEIRWRVQPKDLPRLARQQLEILKTWWPMLAPGGRLVYAVCSLEPEEGPAVVAALQKAQPELEVVAAREWSPADSPGDGFFVANLRRRT